MKTWCFLGAMQTFVIGLAMCSLLQVGLAQSPGPGRTTPPYGLFGQGQEEDPSESSTPSMEGTWNAHQVGDSSTEASTPGTAEMHAEFHRTTPRPYPRRGSIWDQEDPQSVDFRVEVVDRRGDFSTAAMTYFSAERKAYKYHIFNTLNSIYPSETFYIYPSEGKAYYYYPFANFTDGTKSTKCLTWETPKLNHLPSPVPSVSGLTRAGGDIVLDTPTTKYIKRSTDSQTEMWVEEYDYATRMWNRPVRKVYKSWDLSASGIKEVLASHWVTEYSWFARGEKEWAWDRPDVDCSPDKDNSALAAGLIEKMQLIGVPDELLQETSAPSSLRRFKSGRKSYDLDDSLLSGSLPFPYNQTQIKDIAHRLPVSHDWRDFGAVTPVKDQRLCGSCWAFGTVGSLEGGYFLKTGSLVSLSEQAMIDCAGSDKSGGCFGGWEYAGYDWVLKAGGIPPAEEYGPYLQANGYCHIENSPLIAQIDGFYQIPNSADALKVALYKLGPIAVVIDASDVLGYKKGIIRGEDCSGRDPDHVVLLVGYGETDEHETYWILKNSWGTNFGLDGYFLLSADTPNCLGIQDNAYAPRMK